MVNVSTFIDIIISGVGLGALYALVAMGFSLIYKVTGVLNFAQGQLALVGAYGVVILGTSALLSTSLPAVAAVGATILIGVGLGILLERVVFRQFIGEPVLSVIIVTLALSDIFSGFIRFLLGPNYRSYPDALTFGFSIDLPLGTSISAAYALAVALALAVVVVLMLFFRYTVTGSILRASASDEQAAMVLGVSIERTIALAWALSIGITAIGGMLLAMSSGGAGFAIETTGIVIFAAVVFGGLDSIPGAFIGAIVVGLLEELGSYYLEGGSAIIDFGPGFGQILPLVFLLVVIVVKPYGLFGTERIERL
ncbi:MAG: branched-chain amino acid transport system permease protein [Natronomonas sp.]|jgi:branched-chain amino acid transport system permease protein|uniref:branched-chain amino acid ABC transporter permease n=1 Tax=Natronomonas sp. TaxID=2184060 RepID=UPI0039895D9A